MEETIELRELLDIVMKRKWFILLITVIFCVAGVFYSLNMVTPVYEASTTLMVINTKSMSALDLTGGIDLANFSLGQKIVVTYSEIVKSRIVLEQVIKELSLNMTYKELLEITTAQQVNTTEILKIAVVSKSPDEASKIANTISSVFIKEVMRILKVDNVEIIDAAIPMPLPINMRTTMNIAIATILGLMLGVFFAFFIEYVEHKIISEQDVEKYLELPVLGIIPDYAKDMKKMGV